MCVCLCLYNHLVSLLVGPLLRLPTKVKQLALLLTPRALEVVVAPRHLLEALLEVGAL